MAKSKGVFHQPLGFKNTIKRGSRGRPGEWSRPEYSSGDQYQIRVVQESFLQSSILHAFVKITQLQRSRQPSREKAWYSQILTKSKGVFHQPLGFKNTILRGSRGRPGERSRPEYSSGDRYRIRVVQESFFQSSIHCADHPTPTEQATHTGEGLVQPNFDEVKGGFPSTSGIKKYLIKRKQGGDPVKGRG